MSDRLKDLQVKLQRALLILNSITQWEELGKRLGLLPADLSLVKGHLEKESGEPQLQDLVAELKQVHWKSLGIQLNIPYDILDTIDKVNIQNESRKLPEMLNEWMTNHAPSWEKVIDALQRLGGYPKIITSIQSRTNPLAQMLSAWFKNKPEASWERLCSALKELGYETMADEIHQHFIDEGDVETKGDTTPLLKDLVLLHITAWFNLGLRLGIEEHTLNLVSKDNQNDTAACSHAMFSHWLRQSVHPNFQDLIEALCDVNEHTAARQLNDKFGIECPRLYQQSSELAQRSSLFQQYAEMLCSHYLNHQLFPPDQWPPRLSRVFTNLALVLHDKKPLPQHLSDFEKTTLHGTVDDMCFRKYNIELEQIFESDEFFLKKASELKEERSMYTNQIIRLLNMDTPDFLKKRLNIPKDDGKGLPSKEEVKDVFKQPRFLHEPQLRKLLTPKEGASNASGSGTTAFQSRKEISIQSDNISLKVLIDGAPGVGKTTLTWKASKKWAEGNLFKQYKLVVRISLRDLPDDPNSIWQLLPIGSDELKMKVEAELLNSNGKAVLFVLDGWDELTETQRKRGSILYKLVRGDILSQCAIIITSRPYTSRWLQLPDMVPRHVELFGFTQNQIRSCIQHELASNESPEAAQKLIHLLEVRTDIFKLCYIPNNLSIIIHIFSTSNYNLPTTLTKLYQLYIHSAIVRYLQNQCDDLEVPLSYDDETPFPSEVLQLYGSLCMLAFHGLKKSQMVFKDKEIQDLSPTLVKDANTLGLMTAYKCNTVYGIKRSFQFIHATVQEFLAAKALSTWQPEEQIKFALEHMESPQFRMVLFFLAGRSGLQNFERVFQIPVSFEGHLNIERLLLLVRMLFEAQNSKLCGILAQSFPDNSFQLSKFVSSDMPVLTEFDQHMLCYFLQHSSHVWKTIDAHAMESSLLRILEAFKSSCSPKVSFKELHINSNVGDEVYQILADPVFHTIKAIKATFEFPPGEYAHDFFSVHALTHLHFDCYSQDTLEAVMTIASKCSTLQYLGLKSVSKNHMSLQKLLLSASVPFPTIRGEQFCFKCQKLELTDHFTKIICHELAKSRCFEQLLLSDCTLNAHQLSLLFSAVQSNSTLRVFHIRQLPTIKWNSDAVIALKQMVEMNTTLASLQLCPCSLDRQVTMILGQALQTNEHIVSLNLSNNRISSSSDSEEVLCDFKTLGSTSSHVLDMIQTSTIQELVLKECHLDDEAMKSVAQFLSSEQCRLKLLDLSFNNIKENGCKLLFSALATNVTLEVLNLNSNPMWVSGGDQIEMMLKQNHMLKELHLLTNLDMEVIQGITNGIAKNETLTTLKLGNFFRTTPVQGACLVFEALKVNNCLKHLHLLAYDLGNEGTETAAKALTANASLESLSLKSCKFGSSKCTKALVASLYGHKSLIEIAVPTIKGVFKTLFSHYDRINCYRALNGLPYIRMIDPSPPNFAIVDENDVTALLK